MWSIVGRMEGKESGTEPLRGIGEVHSKDENIGTVAVREQRCRIREGEKAAEWGKEGWAKRKSQRGREDESGKGQKKGQEGKEGTRQERKGV